MIVKNKQELFRTQHTPASAVAAGDVVVIGKIVSYATEPIAANALGSVVVAGKAEVVKYGAVSAAAWTPGMKIYYDESEEEFTNVAAGNIYAGVVSPDGTAASAAVVGIILLNIAVTDTNGEIAAVVSAPAAITAANPAAITAATPTGGTTADAEARAEVVKLVTDLTATRAEVVKLVTDLTATRTAVTSILTALKNAGIMASA